MDIPDHVITIPVHISQIFKSLYHMEQQDILCDVLILGEDGCVKAHSVVLSAASAHLRQMFGGNKVNTLYFTGEKIDDLRNIVKFIYTGNISLSITNVKRMKKLFLKLHMDTILTEILKCCPKELRDVASSLKTDFNIDEKPFLDLDDRSSTVSKIDQSEITTESPDDDDVSKDDQSEALTDVISDDGDDDYKSGDDDIAKGEQSEASMGVLTLSAEDDNVEDKNLNENIDSLNYDTSSNSSLKNTGIRKVQRNGRSKKGEKLKIVGQPKINEENPKLNCSLSGTNGNVYTINSDVDYSGNTKEKQTKISNASVKSHIVNSETESVDTEMCDKTSNSMLDISNLSDNDSSSGLKDNTDPEVLKFECKSCDMSFENVELFIEHEETEHGDKDNVSTYNECDKCDYKTKDTRYLMRHKIMEHGDEYDESIFKTYKCEIKGCSFVHFNRAMKDRHVKSHKKKLLKERNKQEKEENPNVKTFKCDICNKILLTEKGFTQHKEGHLTGNRQGPKYYECKFCDKTFQKKGTLDSHVKSEHREEKQFTCHLCPYGAKQKIFYDIHMYKFHDIAVPGSRKVYNCTMCDYFTFIRRNLDIHIDRHNDVRNYKCEICGKKFYRKSSVITHSQRHTAKKEKCPYKGCNFEGIRFGMNQHIKRKHLGKAYICSMCDYKTSVKHSFNMHLKRIHKQVIYTKNELWDRLMETGQGYDMIAEQSRADALERVVHSTFKDSLKSDGIRVEREDTKMDESAKETEESNKSTEKVFLCHLCSYSVKSQNLLDRHLHKLHDIPLPDNRQKFHCTQCDYFTFEKRHLESHLNRHNDIRNYTCEICGKAFYRPSSLITHKKRHIAKRHKCPYEECTYMGLKGIEMTRHIERVHVYKDSKPFQCHICTFKTKQKSSLNYHLQKKHKLEIMTKAKLWDRMMTSGKGYDVIAEKDRNEAIEKVLHMNSKTPSTGTSEVDGEKNVTSTSSPLETNDMVPMDTEYLEISKYPLFSDSAGEQDDSS